jgi:hypothetical protein
MVALWDLYSILWIWMPVKFKMLTNVVILARHPVIVVLLPGLRRQAIALPIECTTTGILIVRTEKAVLLVVLFGENQVYLVALFITPHVLLKIVS